MFLHIINNPEQLVKSLFDHIELHAAAWPLRPAILTLHGALTYGELVETVASVQGVLDGLRLDPDAPVGVLINLPTQFAAVSLALLKSGYCIVPLRDGLVEGAIAAGMKTIITDRRLPIFPGLRFVAFDEKWMLERTPPRPVVAFAPDRVAAVTLTSGSTGRPKAIGFTAGALQERALRPGGHSLQRGARLLTLRGASNSGFQYIRSLASGSTVMFAPMELAQLAINLMNPSTLFASAAQARTLLEMLGGATMPISQMEVNGGQISDATLTELALAFGSDVYLTYGSTEASRAGVCFAALLKRRAALGNCYWPIANVEIVSDNRSSVPRNVEGLVRIRSQSMGWPFKGKLTQSEDDKGDGWFYPGDVGYLSDDGLLVITGRHDDVINDGGVKYSAELMEDILRRHPLISDLGIVRMPTGPMTTQAWIGAVTTSPISLDQIHHWIGNQLQGELSAVRFDRIVKIDKVPRGATGKVARSALKEQLLQLAGQGASPSE